MYICPKCGGDRFYARVIGHSTWMVDANGECVSRHTSIELESVHVDEVLECVECHERPEEVKEADYAKRKQEISFINIALRGGISSLECKPEDSNKAPSM